MGSGRVKSALTRNPATMVPVRKKPLLVHTRVASQISPAENTTIQTKLKVGAANDRYEREADATSAKITSMPEPRSTSTTGDGNGGSSVASKISPLRSDVQREGLGGQPSLDEMEKIPSLPAGHEEPSISAAEDVKIDGLDSSDLDEIEAGVPSGIDDDVQLARAGPNSAVGPEGGDAPEDVERAVANPGPGRPLPSNVLSFMEPRFGISFADVCLHDQIRDRASARKIGARAFTHGKHIWLGEGESASDKKLMSHELTHVVQQTDRRIGAEGEKGLENGAPQKQVNTERIVRRNWFHDKIEKYARHIPGYTLMTVLQGKKLISGKPVLRNATNLIGGFLGLLPGGTLIFDRLRETHALQSAYDWVTGQLSRLDLSWGRITAAVARALELFSIRSPIQSIIPAFAPLARDLVNFIVAIKDKVLEFVIKGALKLAGPYADRVWAVIESSREAISLVLADPLGFAWNLIRSIVRGFQQFGSNILTHLKKGLLGWLFGAMQGLNLQLPAKFDLKGMLSIVFQVMGLTWAIIRRSLVRRLGPSGERKVSYLERSVDITRLLVAEGVAGIWQKMLGMIENFKQTLIGGFITFVTTSLVKAGISWLAGLSNPVGAIIKVALAIYDMIVVFLERFQQITDVVQSIFSSIGAIAKGQIVRAANLVEQSIGRTVPVVISFVAALIPVTGISRSIRNIIQRLRRPVTNAIDNFVHFLVKKAKKNWSKILHSLNGSRQTRGHSFLIGNRQHRIITKKDGRKHQLYIRSRETKADEAQIKVNTQLAEARTKGDQSEANKRFDEVFDREMDEAQNSASKHNPTSKNTSQRRNAQKADTDARDAAFEFNKIGQIIKYDPFIDTEPDDDSQIIRAREPRNPEIEGVADTYSKVGKNTGVEIPNTQGRRWSDFYENDHIPEQSFIRKIKERYSQLKKVDGGDPLIQRSGVEQPPADGASAAFLGTLDTTPIGEKASRLIAITVTRPIHRDKSAAVRSDPEAAINAALAVTTSLSERVAVIRSKIRQQMDAEAIFTREKYASDTDPGTTDAIRSKIREGLDTLYKKNNALYGTDSQQQAIAPQNHRSTNAESVPIGGDATRGIPNFAVLEGERFRYRASGDKNPNSEDSGGTGIGKFMEFDHVIEQSVASKARDLKFNDLGGVVERANSKAVEMKKENGGPDPSQQKKERMTRQGRHNVYDSEPVKNYKKENASTIALYRPVHRVVTRQVNIQKLSFRENVKANETTVDKLAAFMISREPSDLDAARETLKPQIETFFTSALDVHIAKIRDQYRYESEQFAKLNKNDPQAQRKMEQISTRVGSTLRQLRTESLALLG